MMAGSLLFPNGWSDLQQSSNVVRTVVASARMSLSGTTSAHVVRDVVSGGPVCPSRTSVSYVVQSCNMRSVKGWILCSARVRASASCWYRVQCRGAGLGWGVEAARACAPSFRLPCVRVGWRAPGCTRHLLVRVSIPGGSHPWTRLSVGISRCVPRGGPFCHAGRWCGLASNCVGSGQELPLFPRGLLAMGHRNLRRRSSPPARAGLLQGSSRHQFWFSLPCTTTPSSDCSLGFCKSLRSSWMYASVSRLSPVAVICWSISLSALYRLHVGRWCASTATCSTLWMLSCSGSLSRSLGLWFAQTSRPLGSDSRGGLEASGGVDSWEWVSIAVPDVPLDTDSGASCMWSSGVLGCAVFVTNGSVCGSGVGALSRSPWCCASC